MKIDLDKFYTPVEVAKECINEVDIFSYDTIIEPSAGNGSFFNQITNCIGYDIEPENPKIIKQDFLALNNVSGEHILFIGNPPFGKRSSLAKDFIKHCISLKAETIAFILPNTFNKYSLQKVFPSNWKLRKIIELDCKYKTAEINYFVPSSFFVWTKREGINLRKTKPKEITDFSFLSRGDKRADFSINGNSGKVKEISQITNSKAEHYIYVNDRTKIEEVKNNLKNTKFIFYSSVNGKNAWISQNDIKEQYNDCKRI